MSTCLRELIFSTSALVHRRWAVLEYGPTIAEVVHRLGVHRLETLVEVLALGAEGEWDVRLIILGHLPSNEAVPLIVVLLPWVGAARRCGRPPGT